MKNNIYFISLVAGSFFLTSCGGNPDNKEDEERGQQLEERGFGGDGADPSSGTVVSDDSSTVPAQGAANDTTNTPVE